MPTGLLHMQYLFDIGQDAVAIHVGIPRRNALITRQHFEGSGFASSIEAKQTKALPFADCQGDPVHSQQGLLAVIHLGGTQEQDTWLQEGNALL